MGSYADQAFGAPVHCGCSLTQRDAMLDAKLRQAQQDLRKAEDELAVWRGLSSELTCLRGLRDIVREECWKAHPDTALIDRAVKLCAPSTVTDVNTEEH